jgi:hypothetical protein
VKPRITVITIGVEDLERSFLLPRRGDCRGRYRRGAKFEHGAVAFFDLQAGEVGRVLRTSISHDPAFRWAASQQVHLGHNVVKS